MTGGHWALQWIGKRYGRDADGPEAFNCWTFFAAVQRAQFGRDVPLVDNVDFAANLRAFAHHDERGRWIEVGERRSPGDGVLLRRGRYASHVGVWIEVDGFPGVLHCVEGVGGCFQTLPALGLHGWQIEGVYRPADEEGVACRA